MSSAAYKHINLDYLELMSDGDSDMKKTMLEMLLAEIPDEFSKMRGLVNDQNWEELTQVSHKMKSTLAFVGNEELTNANKQLELLSKNEEDFEQIRNLMSILESKLEFVTDELQVEHDSI